MYRILSRTIITLGVGSLAFVGIAGVEASSAQAAASLSSIITTPDSELASVFSVSPSPTQNIQAIPAYDSNQVVLAFADTQSYVTVADPNGEINLPRAVAFSPEGSIAYVANYGSDKVAIVDIATGSVIDTFSAYQDRMTAIAVSPDGSRIVVVDDWSRVTVYDPTDNFAQVWSTGVARYGYINAFFVDDAKVIIASMTADVTILDISTSTGLNFWDNQDSGGAGICISPDSSELIWVSGNSISVVDSETGATLRQTSIPAGSDFKTCTVTNMGKLLVADASADPSNLFIVNLDDLILDQALSLPGQAKASGVSVTRECIAFVAGLETNISVIALTDDICAKPAVSLADTGMDASTVGWMLAGGVALLAAGVLLMARWRM